MKEVEEKRHIAAQSYSFRAYEDNYEEMIGICNESGRKSAEELRDLLDEALALRRRRANGDLERIVPAGEQTMLTADEITKLAEVLQQISQANAYQTQMILHFSHHMREQYGLLLETLAGAYGARHLVWKYVAEPMLQEAGLSLEQIRLRYEDECRTWNRQRDQAADVLEEAIKNLRPGS
jgi:hypothetical protein